MNEVVITSDNSSSIYSSQYDALYHSKHGAIQESEHVFIAAGYKFFLEKKPQNNIKILELGFGTGLNALLTARQCQNHNINVEYTALEAYPLSDITIALLNHGTELGSASLFTEIHKSSWNNQVKIGSCFKLNKVKTLFEEYQTSEFFDIIYFDAFAPDIQEELWGLDIMKKMYSFSKKGSILVTYSAKGVVRRTMEEVGFEVERIPGPVGKREMIRATRSI